MGIIIICVLFVIFLLLWAIIDIVPQSEARVMERLGIFREAWGAGIHLKFPILDKCAVKVDLREQVMELPKLYKEGASTSWGTDYDEKGQFKGIDRISNGFAGSAAATGAGTGIGFSGNNKEGVKDAAGGAVTFAGFLAGALHAIRTAAQNSKYEGYEKRRYVDFRRKCLRLFEE